MNSSFSRFFWRRDLTQNWRQERAHLAQAVDLPRRHPQERRARCRTGTLQEGVPPLPLGALMAAVVQLEPRHQAEVVGPAEDEVQVLLADAVADTLLLAAAQPRADLEHVREVHLGVDPVAFGHHLLEHAQKRALGRRHQRLPPLIGIARRRRALARAPAHDQHHQRHHNQTDEEGEKRQVHS